MIIIRLILPILILLSVFSCRKERNSANNLNRGNGTWLVESIQIEEFDTLGNLVLDTTYVNYGEMIFLKSAWGTTNTYFGKFIRFNNDGTSEIGATQYEADSKIVYIDSWDPFFTDAYNQDKDGTRNQEWRATRYFTSQHYDNRIQQIKTVKLNKGKSF